MLTFVLLDPGADGLGPPPEKLETFVFAKLLASIVHQRSPATQHEHMLPCEQRGKGAGANGALECIKKLLLVWHQLFDVIQTGVKSEFVPTRFAMLGNGE